ncbi:hypothetical protein GmHk_05G013042 [Glycine max]|nr:hypothetical protein GmHk_05G013042 [Glycine max]
MESTMEELINKTQLSPKIIPTSSRQLGGLNRISLPAPYCCHSVPMNKVCDHHSYQPQDTKLQG